MPWTRPALNDIYQRIITGIESRLTGGVAILRYAVLRIMAKVFAGEIHLNYGYSAFMSKQLFIDTSENTYLDRWAYMWGVQRKTGAFSSGEATFTGANTTVIAKGTQVQTAEGVVYETIAETTISSGSATTTIQCIEVGAIGNFVGGNIQLISPIEFVDSTVVAGELTGGQDIESDVDLRKRILQRIQTPPMGGAKHDYVRWALEATDVDGVSLGCDGAWCFSPEDSPVVNGGIVRVVFRVAGNNPVPMSPVFIDNGSGYDGRNNPNGNGDMYDYLAERKPVTADLQVFPIDKQDVDMEIEILPYTSALAQSVQDKLQELFDNVAAPGSTLLIAQIRDAIMSAGVTNYSISSIDVESTPQAIGDIIMTGFQYPVMGTITISSI
jgi:uncharacterized phage protein gp47/JayE